MQYLSSSFTLTLCAAFALFTTACSSGGNSTSNSGNTVRWTSGSFPPADNFYNRCENPRTTGTSIVTGEPHNEQPGSASHEKMWIRSVLDDVYLWNNLLQDRSPNTGGSVTDYYSALLPSRDRFSFALDESIFINQIESGVETGFGIEWFIAETSETSLVYYISYIDSSSPYANQLERGDQLISVDGLDAELKSNAGAVQSVIFSALEGDSHDLVFYDADSNEDFMLSMQATSFSLDPVPVTQVIQTDQGDVGYILFNSHNEISEQGLIDAITQLRDSNVTDLVLDLRYNLGGLLDVASRLSYMIAGSEATEGKTFSLLTFNDDYEEFNPITGEANDPFPFYSESSDQVTLPSLDFERVFVLTGLNTCSASESIINGLKGVDIDVFQIGHPTCGKPYGSIPLANCGKIYSFLQFQSVNDKGFGDYEEGFRPTTESLITTDDQIPGCFAVESLNAPLGDPDEKLLNMALQFRSNGSCSTAVNNNLALGNENQPSYSKPAPTLKPIPIHSTRVGGNIIIP